MRLPARALRTAAAVLALCELAACNDPASTQSLGVMQVISGGRQADTVDALAAELLVIEVRDRDGGIMPGVTVNLATIPEDSLQYTGRLMGLCVPAVPTCSRYGISTRTDAGGQVAMQPTFGTIAGTEWIRVAVPELGIKDSVPFETLPGAAVHIAFRTSDSSAYVGSGYATGPYVVDRHGNAAAPQSIAARSIGPAATVSSDGTFRAVALGRGAAEFRAGGITDTAWITVPPRGHIVAFDLGVSGPPGIVTFELDGSGRRRLTGIEQTDMGQTPDWLPDGRVLFEGNGSNVQRLLVVDSLGFVQRVTPGSTPTFAEVQPASARDGKIFFAGRGPGDADFRLWVSAGIGQVPVRADAISDSTAYTMPAPAPAGDDLAYIILERGLFVLDRGTGSNTKLAPATAWEVWPRAPRWSPDGTQIAFSDDTTLYVIHPDGTGRRPVGPKHLYYPRADWSPDGNWLIARTHNRLELINVLTDEAVVMPPWTLPYLAPAWRPAR
jgi:hypothetical protein